MFQIKIRGLKKVQKQLKKFQREVGRLQKFLLQIAVILRKEYEREFDRERSVKYGRWRRLAKSTQRERTYYGFGPKHPILQRSGKFGRSFYDINSPTHKEVIGSGGFGKGQMSLTAYTLHTPAHSVTKEKKAKTSSRLMVHLQENKGRRILLPHNLYPSGVAYLTGMAKRSIRAREEKLTKYLTSIFGGGEGD